MPGVSSDLSIEFLLDAGAVPSILDINVYEALAMDVKRPLRRTRIMLIGAFENALKVFGETMLKFEIGDIEFEISMIVVDLAGAQEIWE